MDMDFVCTVELEYGRMVDFSRIIEPLQYGNGQPLFQFYVDYHWRWCTQMHWTKSKSLTSTYLIITIMHKIYTYIQIY